MKRIFQTIRRLLGRLLGSCGGCGSCAPLILATLALPVLGMTLAELVTRLESSPEGRTLIHGRPVSNTLYRTAGTNLTHHKDGWTFAEPVRQARTPPSPAARARANIPPALAAKRQAARARLARTNTVQNTISTTRKPTQNKD